VQLPLQPLSVVLPRQSAEPPEQNRWTVRLWASAPQPVPAHWYSVVDSQTHDVARKKPDESQQGPEPGAHSWQAPLAQPMEQLEQLE